MLCVAIGDESGEGEDASCLPRHVCKALRSCETVKDAGVGSFFLRFAEDAFDVLVCGAVVDDERDLRFLGGEDVVAKRGFLEGSWRMVRTEEIESAFSEGYNMILNIILNMPLPLPLNMILLLNLLLFGVLFCPSEQLLCGWRWVFGGEVGGVCSCGAEDAEFLR